MPGKEVKVRIRGMQVSHEGEVSRTKTAADGILYEKNGRMFLLYSERSEDGSVTKSVVKYNKDSMNITRNGQITSSFTFSENEHCRSSYIVPYGTFSVDIDTESYVLQEQRNRTLLSASYRLSVEGGQPASCRIEMEIKHHED